MKPQTTPEEGSTTKPTRKLLVHLKPAKLTLYNTCTTTTSAECVPENQNRNQTNTKEVPENRNQDKKTKKEEPDLTTPETETRIGQKTLPELRRKPLSEPDQKPNKGTRQHQNPKQRNKVTNKVVKINDLKLFLERKRLERESKLKPKISNFTPPNETSPSNTGVSATLSPPPEKSLPQSAPRADDQKSAMFFKKSNGDQTSSASNEGYQ